MDTLFVSDLDGTLINSEALLSDYSLRQLQALVDEGLPFTVASARSILSMQQILRGLRLPLPVICFNGAFLTDLASGRHEMVHSIRPDVAESIFDRLPRHACVPFLSTYTGTEERVYYHRVINEGMQWYVDERAFRKDPRFRHAKDLRHGLRDRVVCMTIINRKEILDDLEQDILESHLGEVEVHHYENQYSPGWYWLTVHDHRASKDQAIAALKDHCGIGHMRVVAFGDNKNDVSMFRAADHAVAVSNAVIEARRHADEIIGSNEEDSVVRYLRQRWHRSPRG